MVQCYTGEPAPVLALVVPRCLSDAFNNGNSRDIDPE